MSRKPPVFVTMPMLRRAQQLRGAGLSYAAIVAVLGLDYGHSPGEDTIRKWLHKNGEPKRTRGNRLSVRGKRKGAA